MASKKSMKNYVKKHCANMNSDGLCNATILYRDQNKLCLIIDPDLYKKPCFIVEGGECDYWKHVVLPGIG